MAYYVNTANADNNTPLYRFYNFRKGVHFYTASEAEKNAVVTRLSTTYRLEGPAYSVCSTAVADAVPAAFDHQDGAVLQQPDPALQRFLDVGRLHVRRDRLQLLEHGVHAPFEHAWHD